jgi:hypothetical protein
MASAPLLAPWPAPGGNTSIVSGISPAHTGGFTRTLDNFNPAAYSDLYYGIGDYVPWPTFDPSGPSLTMDGSKDVLSFNAGQSDLLNGKAVWTGTTNFVTYNFGNQVIPTRFTLTVTDLSNNSLALTNASSIVGLPSSLGAVLDVQSGFKANWLFEANGPSSSDGFQASLAMYDSSLYQTYAKEQYPQYAHSSSVGGAFYYTAPVPEADTYAFMALGMGLVGWLARRRKA